MSVRLMNEETALELFGIPFPTFLRFAGDSLGDGGLTPEELKGIDALFAAGGTIGRLAGGGYVAGPRADVEAAIIGSMVAGVLRRH